MPWRPGNTRERVSDEDLALVAAYFGADGPCLTLVDMARQEAHEEYDRAGRRPRSPQVLTTHLHRALRFLGFPHVDLARRQSRTDAFRAQVLAALRTARHQHLGRALWPPRRQP